jgi:hypothetical protein
MLKYDRKVSTRRMIASIAEGLVIVQAKGARNEVREGEDIYRYF